MKKLIALICLLGICLPLCACGGGSLAAMTGENENPTEENKTLSDKEEEKDEIVYPEGFSVGFGRADISGPLPVDVWEGQATVVGDPLMLTVVAVCDGENVALLVGADALGIKKSSYKSCAKLVAKYNIPPENLLINATHSHSAPSIGGNARWLKNFYSRFTEAVEAALRDLTPAKAFAGEGETKNFAFVRRYLQPDGSYITQGNKSSVKHETEADRSLRTIRFEREGKKDVLMTNWQSHYMGGIAKGKLSSDVFGNFRSVAEKELDCHFAYFSGSSGNLNFNSPIPGEKTVNSREEAAEEFVKAVREAIAGEKEVQTGKIRAASSTYAGTVMKDSPERLAQAKEIASVGRDSAEGQALIKKYGFSSKYAATAVITRHNLGDTVDMEFFAVSFGDIAFSTVPFEQFDTNGQEVRAASPFPVTFTLSITNDHNGYVPSALAFPHGAYEVGQTKFVEGSAEEFVREQLRLLNECKAAA